jgi:hypothetical protein
VQLKSILKSQIISVIIQLVNEFVSKQAENPPMVFANGNSDVRVSGIHYLCAGSVSAPV